MWGGRFNKRINRSVENFTKSIDYDYKLAQFDVQGSLIHVFVLKECGFLSAQEAKKLFTELKKLSRSMHKGTFRYDKDAEDIHTCIQNILEKKCGDAALKLQTARSRNEQVVFATKGYCSTNTWYTSSLLEFLIASLTSASFKNRNVIIPGFTHMQHAQPVRLEEFFEAYAYMLNRDSERLKEIGERLIPTMGAGSLAGTPIDYKIYEKAVEKLVKVAPGLSPTRFKPVINSIDAVSDRDFVVEILSALAITGMHLSRLSEDLILWSTKEFGFIEIGDAFCTGSSLMPQKKNPDVLELIRGYTGRLYGNLISVLTTLKGLPLSYNRDMQLDKQPLFDSFKIVSDSAEILASLVDSLKFNQKRINEQLTDESLYATDIVYYLVNKGVAFKSAHTILGKLIKYSIDHNIEIKDMSESKIKQFSNKLIKKEILKLFDPKISVDSKKSVHRYSKDREALGSLSNIKL